MKKIIPIIFVSLLACKQKPSVADNAKPEAKTTSTEITLTPQQMTTGGIETAEVVKAMVNRTIKLNGVVDVPPQNMVSITCPMGGYIKRLNLLPGQQVQKGEVIILMEDPAYIQLQQDFLAGKSKLEYLQKEYERQKALAVEDATSQKNFQLVTADYKTAQINQSALREKLALIGIDASKLSVENISRQVAVRSPIHGFVAKVSLNTGRYVNPTDVLAELVDPEDIHAMLTVFEKDIPYLRKDQQVFISILDRPETRYNAEVLLVTKTLDENRSGLVHCHFKRYFPELLPGMFVSAEIEVGEAQLPAVPETAVVFHEGKHYVLVETGNHNFKLTQVEIGEKQDGKVGLLNEPGNNLIGKKVVTKGSFAVLGMLLKSENE